MTYSCGTHFLIKLPQMEIQTVSLSQDCQTHGVEKKLFSPRLKRIPRVSFMIFKKIEKTFAAGVDL